MGEPTMHIRQLTFTRFIAAICIVIFHFGKSSFPFNDDSVFFITEQLHIGVSYFFVLSGFVLMVAYAKFSRIPFSLFIANRLSRIYPLYLFSLCIIAVLYIPVDVKDGLLSVLMIQSWFPGKALTLNGPGWSLSVELFFYLIFPFLFNHIYSAFSLKNLVTGGLLFFTLSQVVLHYNGFIAEHTYYTEKDLIFHPLFHLNKFVLGNIAGLFYLRATDHTSGRNYALYITGTLVLLLILLKQQTYLIQSTGMLPLLFTTLIVLLSLDKSKVSLFFSSRPFVFLGEISFGVYILQLPVWQVVSDRRLQRYLHLDKEADATIAFFLRVLILIASAAIVYRYIEKPIQAGLKNFFSARLKKNSV